MSAKPDTIKLTSRVPRRAAGRTLLDYLAERFRYCSPKEWAEHIANGRVTVNDACAAAQQQLTAGDVVGYAREASEPEAPTDVRIVHDRAGIVVIDKPAGLPFHADGAFLTRTVVGVLEPMLGCRIRPVQRLDRETSGLCVVARDRVTARGLHQALAAQRFEKTYEALGRGVVADDRIVVDRPIGRSPTSEISIRRAVVAADAAAAQPAITEFEVTARAPRATWLRCRPRTGRTHQIRVHLESIGVPLIGDKLYGRSDAEYLAWIRHVKAGGEAAWSGRLGAPRQMLHASRLAFSDPATGARNEFFVDPPPDFVACARREGLVVAGH